MDPSFDRIISSWFGRSHHYKRCFTQSNELMIRYTMTSIKSSGKSVCRFWTAQRGSATSARNDSPPGPTSRNIFRGLAESYSRDTKALVLAVKGIAKGQDRKDELMQLTLFYLSFMHSESLHCQLAAVSSYKNFLQRCWLGSSCESFSFSSYGFIKRHRDVILSFGGFSSCNTALGNFQHEARIFEGATYSERSLSLSI